MNDEGLAQNAQGNRSGGAGAPGTVGGLGKALLAAWRPSPVSEPSLDPNTSGLPAIERVAEILRYNVLAAEHAISPNGGLRAWLKLNVLAAAVIFIPAMILVPAVTYLLSGFADWAHFLSKIAIGLLITALALVGGILTLVVGGRVVLFLLKTGKR